MSGEVPEGWREAPFSDLARYDNGRAFKPADWGNEGLPIVRIAQITNPDAETNRYFGEVEDRHRLNDGDLIFSWSATLAVMKWRRGPAVLNQHLFKVTPAAGIDQDWLQFRLERSIPDLTEEAHGTTMKHIRKGTLSSQTTLVPPFDEQRRIAEVLRSVDEAIRIALAAIEQADLVHTGLLDALTVSDAENPWPEVKLGDLVADPITYGVVQPGTYLDEGVILVRGGDFPDGQISIGELPRISPAVARPYERSTLRGGEILISLVGYPGACALVPVTLAGANISRSAALVRPSEEINRDFLYYFIRSPIGQKRVLINSIGSAQQVVNLKDLREVMVPVPPHEQQENIASVMKVSMRNVLLAKKHLKILTSLKASIASDLLSGRVRVPA